MTELMVIESEDEGFTHKIIPLVAGSGIEIVRVTPHEYTLARTPDILVVSPDCTQVSPVGAFESSKLKCGILLLPEGCRAGFADAKCVVTYGMNPKNTLTLSSIGEKKCLLALQRELLTASGRIVERQELIVPCIGNINDLLALSGILLLLELLPE